MKVSHSNTVWLGYRGSFYVKYSIGGVNMGEGWPQAVAAWTHGDPESPEWGGVGGVLGGRVDVLNGHYKTCVAVGI